MLVQFPSVHLSVTGICNRQTDGRKITEGDMADDLMMFLGFDDGQTN